jgi:DnaK suppressor protein
MNVDHYKTILLQKERELIEEMGRRRDDALDSGITDVEDPIDSVISTTGRDTAMQEGSMLYDTLAMVRDALQRIKDGTFGICIDCEEPIGEARLDAVPWTPYCVVDQQKHDKEAAENRVQTLGDLA